MRQAIREPRRQRRLVHWPLCDDRALGRLMWCAAKCGVYVRRTSSLTRSNVGHVSPATHVKVVRRTHVDVARNPRHRQVPDAAPWACSTKVQAIAGAVRNLRLVARAGRGQPEGVAKPTAEQRPACSTVHLLTLASRSLQPDRQHVGLLPRVRAHNCTLSQAFVPVAREGRAVPRAAPIG